jgi:hypothetical protein
VFLRTEVSGRGFSSQSASCPCNHVGNIQFWCHCHDLQRSKSKSGECTRIVTPCVYFLACFWVILKCRSQCYSIYFVWVFLLDHVVELLRPSLCKTNVIVFCVWFKPVNSMIKSLKWLSLKDFCWWIGACLHAGDGMLATVGVSVEQWRLQSAFKACEKTTLDLKDHKYSVKYMELILEDKTTACFISIMNTLLILLH